MRFRGSSLVSGCFIPAALIGLASLAGWLTHIFYCINHENWLFLIAGAIGAPIGVIHGWGLWFGWFH